MTTLCTLGDDVMGILSEMLGKHYEIFMIASPKMRQVAICGATHRHVFRATPRLFYGAMRTQHVNAYHMDYIPPTAQSITYVFITAIVPPSVWKINAQLDTQCTPVEYAPGVKLYEFYGMSITPFIALNPLIKLRCFVKPHMVKGLPNTITKLNIFIDGTQTEPVKFPDSVTNLRLINPGVVAICLPKYLRKLSGSLVSVAQEEWPETLEKIELVDQISFPHKLNAKCITARKLNLSNHELPNLEVLTAGTLTGSPEFYPKKLRELTTGDVSNDLLRCILERCSLRCARIPLNEDMQGWNFDPRIIIGVYNWTPNCDWMPHGGIEMVQCSDIDDYIITPRLESLATTSLTRSLAICNNLKGLTLAHASAEAIHLLPDSITEMSVGYIDGLVTRWPFNLKTVKITSCNMLHFPPNIRTWFSSHGVVTPNMIKSMSHSIQSLCIPMSLLTRADIQRLSNARKIGIVFQCGNQPWAANARICIVPIASPFAGAIPPCATCDEEICECYNTSECDCGYCI